MLRLQNRNQDPRAQFKRDFKEYVDALQQKGHYVAVLGDFNDHLYTWTQTFQKFLASLLLVDPMATYHDLNQEPSSYARVPNRVDYMLVTKDLLPFITACGYDPFNENVFSDHCLMFMDIHQDLFTREDKGFARSSRGVIASKPASLCQYVDTLHEQCKVHNMMERAKAIKQLTQPDHTLVEKFDREL